MASLHGGGCTVASDELRMRGHRVHAGSDDLPDAVGQSGNFLLGYEIDCGVILSRFYMLPQHNLNPAGDCKHFLCIAEETPAILEQADRVGERLRNGQATAILPKVTDAALRGT